MNFKLTKEKLYLEFEGSANELLALKEFLSDSKESVSVKTPESSPKAKIRKVEPKEVSEPETLEEVEIAQTEMDEEFGMDEIIIPNNFINELADLSDVSDEERLSFEIEEQQTLEETLSNAKKEFEAMTPETHTLPERARKAQQIEKLEEELEYTTNKIKKVKSMDKVQKVINGLRFVDKEGNEFEPDNIDYVERGIDGELSLMKAKKGGKSRETITPQEGIKYCEATHRTLFLPYQERVIVEHEDYDGLFKELRNE